MRRSSIWKRIIITMLVCVMTGNGFVITSAAAQTVQFEDDLGDFCFFHSDYPYGQGTGYPNMTYATKNNQIIFEAIRDTYTYQDPNKSNAIIMKKTRVEDCYIDIEKKIFPGYDSNKIYRDFKMTGEFECNFTDIANSSDMLCHLFLLKSDKQLKPTLAIGGDGSLVVNDNGGNAVTTIRDVAQNGKRFRVTMYVSRVSGAWHQYTAFLECMDGEGRFSTSEKIAENVAVYIDEIKFLRISCRSVAYRGTLKLQHVSFTGLDKAFRTATDTEVRTSMFETVDNDVKSYLKDKVAMCYYGAAMLQNGTRRRMTTPPVLKNDELYISLADFNEAFSANVAIVGDQAVYDAQTVWIDGNVTHTDGTALVPVQRLARKLLSKETLLTEDGLLVAADKPLALDTTNETPYHKRTDRYGRINRLSTLQYINDYVAFDRPGASDLLTAFEKSGKANVHPRILATKEVFDGIKRQKATDAYLLAVVDGIVRQAEDELARPATERIPAYRFDDDLRMTSVGDSLARRMFLYGFAYQMTGAQKYADAVWENLAAVARFPDLNYWHPIDAGSFGVGIAIGYDWCCDAFTAEQRTFLRDHAKRLYLSVLDETFYGRTPVKQQGYGDGITINMQGLYNKWISNYNTWVNGGNILMALAFMDEQPSLCASLLQNSIRSMEYSVKNFYPQGTWAESSDYWDTTLRYLAYAFGALDQIYGTDFNLSSFKGVRESGLVNVSIQSPLGNYCFHDAKETKEYASRAIAFWGKYFSQPQLSAIRRSVVEKQMQTPDAGIKYVPHVFDALFYDPDAGTAAMEKLDRVVCAKGLETFAVHEDYQDPNAFFFASHAGPTSFYHSHNDNGDFVFDMHGVRWATSLDKKYAADSTQYGRRTEGHNTLVINNTEGYNQIENRHTPILESGTNEKGTYAIYDLSDAYRDASVVHRGFFIASDYKALTVRDEITLNQADSELYWFMHTGERITIDPTGTGATLTSADGKTLYLTFETNAAVAEISQMEAKPLPTSPQGALPDNYPYKDVRKVAIRLVGSGDITLTVRLGAERRPAMDMPHARWNAADQDASVLLYENMDSIVGLSGTAVKKVPRFSDCVVKQDGTVLTGGEREGTHSVLALHKPRSDNAVAGVFQVDLSQTVANVQRYRSTFQIKPDITSANGSFILYAGAVAQIEKIGTGRYRLCKYGYGLQPQKFDIGNAVPIEPDGDGYFTFGVETDGSTASFYVNDKLVWENIPQHNANPYTRLSITLNKSFAGSLYIDNLEVREPAALQGVVTGDTLHFEGYLPSVYQNSVLMIGGYDALGNLLEAKIPMELPGGRFHGTYVLPGSYSRIKAYLWDAKLAPICTVYEETIGRTEEPQ